MELSVFKYDFRLAEPLSISFHTFYYRENVLITLKYKNFIGMGEAAPFKSITGDSQEDVLRDAKRIKQIPLNPKEHNLESLHRFLDLHVTSQTLKAAIDFAYHDLIGKITKVPVYKIYTNIPIPVENSITIFVSETLGKTESDTLAAYRKDPKIKIIKIKLKGEKDIERVKSIKKVSPKKIKFILDANQGFKNPREAVKTLHEISKILGKVILVEEPCPKGELDKLKFVKDNVKNMLIIADESAATLSDVLQIVKTKAAHGINIKLQKAGGIWPAKKIADLCVKNDLKIMVGCMLEGPLGIAAGTHFAVSTPNIILTDLDGDLDMPPHTNGIALSKNGKRLPNENFGLGVTLNEQKMFELAKNGDVIYQQEL